MSLKSDLYAYLIAAPTVAALVSTRVYPSFVGSMAAPLPYVCYDQTSTQAEASMTGPVDIAMAALSFQCWAVDAPAADEISHQVRKTLDGYRGTMGSTDIRRIFYDTETDTIEVPSEGGSLRPEPTGYFQ